MNHLSSNLNAMKRRHVYMGMGVMALMFSVTSAAPSAFASVVLPNTCTFLLTRNKVRFTHQAVVDTGLSEFFVSPDSIGWLNNKVRFQHLKVQE